MKGLAVVFLSVSFAQAQYTISTYAGGGPLAPGLGTVVSIRSLITDAAGNALSTPSPAPRSRGIPATVDQPQALGYGTPRG
jgi:hypothetical protein